MWSNHPENHEVIDNTESDTEKPLVTPRFDEEAIRQAKPAIPLSQIVAQRVNPKVLIVAVLIAGLIGSIIGSVLSVRYFNSPAEPKTALSASTQAPEPQVWSQENETKAPSKLSNTNLSSSAANHQDESITQGSEKS